MMPKQTHSTALRLSQVTSKKHTASKVMQQTAHASTAAAAASQLLHQVLIRLKLSQ